MRRPRYELTENKHQPIIDDLNEFCAAIKVHLWNVGNEETKQRHPKPTIQEIDELQARINAALREHDRPVRR